MQSKNSIDKENSNYDSQLPSDSERFNCGVCDFVDECRLKTGETCNVFENDNYEIVKEVE